MADKTTIETAAEMDAQPDANKQAAATDVDPQAELVLLRKALADRNKEEASRRKKLEELERREAEREKASMSELEKAQASLAEALKKAEQAETGRRAALIAKAVIAGASTRGFADTEDALRFIDQAKVTVDENGAVEGINDQLDALAKSKPYLLAQTEQQQGRLGATNPGRGNAGGETDAQKRGRLFGTGGGNPLIGSGGGLVFP